MCLFKVFFDVLIYLPPKTKHPQISLKDAENNRTFPAEKGKHHKLTTLLYTSVHCPFENAYFKDTFNKG